MSRNKITIVDYSEFLQNQKTLEYIANLLSNMTTLPKPKDIHLSNVSILSNEIKYCADDDCAENALRASLYCQYHMELNSKKILNLTNEKLIDALENLKTNYSMPLPLNFNQWSEKNSSNFLLDLNDFKREKEKSINL